MKTAAPTAQTEPAARSGSVMTTPPAAKGRPRATRRETPSPLLPLASGHQLVQAVCRSHMVHGGDGWVDLLSQARRENRKRNITGVLARQGEEVLLVLEGTAERVGEALSAIGRDPRHEGFHVVRVKPALKRDFPGWWMASTQLDAERFDRIEGAFAGDDPDAGRRLRAFIVDGEWLPEQSRWADAPALAARRANHISMGPAADGPASPALAVRSVRARSGLTQVEFARRFGVPLHTLRNWEQGKRVPTGAAATLIRVMDVMPEVVCAITASATGATAPL
ncbi:MAG: helix-turn-helix domain-containing protein [Rhodocyclaceae bacterium]|nr:helix-turn-helix domain-containing protein [Rhodocyclaceae bacterium]